MNLIALFSIAACALSCAYAWDWDNILEDLVDRVEFRPLVKADRAVTRLEQQFLKLNKTLTIKQLKVAQLSQKEIYLNLHVKNIDENIERLGKEPKFNKKQVNQMRKERRSASDKLGELRKTLVKAQADLAVARKIKEDNERATKKAQDHVKDVEESIKQNKNAWWFTRMWNNLVGTKVHQKAEAVRDLNRAIRHEMHALADDELELQNKKKESAKNLKAAKAKETQVRDTLI